LISSPAPETTTVSFGFKVNSSPGFTLLDNNPQLVSKRMPIETASKYLIRDVVMIDLEATQQQRIVNRKP